MAGTVSPLAPSAQTGEEAMRSLFGVCVGFIVIDTVFLVLRFYTVLCLRRKRLSLTWDDWLLVPAYILNLGMLANGLVIHQYGIQSHSTAGGVITDPTQNIPIWKCLFVITQLKNPSFAFTRFSLLALFLRLFRGRFTRLTCYFLIAFVVAQTLAFNIAGIFQCSPVDYFWKQGYGVKYGTCFDFNMFYRALVPPEIFVDVVLIWLPIPEIWALKSSRSRKLGLTVLFLSGSLALMSNCFRLASYWRHTITGAVPSVANAIVSWCNAEMSVCFIVACIPAMHPLFQRLVPSSIRRRITRHLTSTKHPQLGKNSTASSSEIGFRHLADSHNRSDSPFAGQASSDATAKHDENMDGLEAAKNRDAPVDLKDIEHGEGVLVETEIMVFTQEEVIEDVLGF